MKLKEFQQLDIFDKIVFVGDSQVEFLKASYSDFVFVNLGISGERIEGLCLRLPTILLEKPKEIILLIGLNDILANKSICQIAHSFIKLFKILNENQVTYRIVEILPVGLSLNDHNKRIKTINAVLYSLTNSVNIISLTESEFFSEEMFLDSKFSNDGIHLNKTGYNLLVNYIMRY
jgi:lysophospholipase L1-like esterase